MIEVDLWELVRDWIHARYKHIKVRKFTKMTNYYPTTHLGRITVKLPKQELEEIGFVAPKGVIIWPPGDHEKRKFKYEIFKATDPKMFEKVDEMLRKYEPKRSK